jgi:hypothetical protein
MILKPEEARQRVLLCRRLTTRFGDLLLKKKEAAALVAAARN